MLVFGESKAELWANFPQVDKFVRERLDLALRPEVTRLLPVAEGIPFLGFVLFPGVGRFDPARARRWRSRMRALKRALDGG